MIVLDTNVLSEVITPQPSPPVLAWILRELPSNLYTTSISQAELLYGVELLPKGRRRSALHAAVVKMLAEDFADRILPFDSDAAEDYSRIAAARRAMGRPISEADARIAAITVSRGARLATRNTRDFEHCGIKVVNPWSPPLT
jgi:predicted nucleic acid-binding protein